MANVTISSNYAGELALPFVAPAILAADTLANGYISVLDNVRYKANLKKVVGPSIASRTCEFNTPTTGIALSDVVLTTAQLQINEQICNQDLGQDWAATQMRGAGAGAPGDYVNFLGQVVAAKVASDVELNIWQGNFDSTGGSSPSNTSFDGILDAIADASPSHETLTAGAWTGDADGTTGILTHLAALVADAPAAVAGDPDAKIFISRKSANLYYQALAATYNLPFLNDGVVARYAGYDIVAPAGFADDTALLGKKDNFYFGTNLLTDMIEARFLDLTGVTGDDVTRIVMLFDCGTAVVDHDSYSVARRSS